MLCILLLNPNRNFPNVPEYSLDSDQITQTYPKLGNIFRFQLGISFLSQLNDKTIGKYWESTLDKENGIYMDFLFRIELFKHYTSNSNLHKFSNQNPSFVWEIRIDSNQFPENFLYGNFIIAISR